MTSADDARINAMATARAVKAIRLYVEIGVMIGHPPTEQDIDRMALARRDAAVRAAGVKVASKDTWEVTGAVARAFEHANARHTAEIPTKRIRKPSTGLPLPSPRVCLIPDCGCDGIHA